MSESPADPTTAERGRLDLDPAAFARLERIGGPAFVHRIGTLFLAEAPPKLARLHASVTDGAAEELAYWSHSLVSSSGNLGLARVQALARALERAGRAGDWPAVPALVAELDAAFARATALLGDHLATLPAS
jgi:HPt (histidine-containing phosphotransfer) domain-containing protein